MTRLFWTAVAVDAALFLILFVAGLATKGIADTVIDYQVRQDAEGSGYFSGRDTKAAGRAVVRRDTAALRAVGRRIDVNAKGTRGMTLMELAVTRAWESTGPSERGALSLDIVRQLLSFGADPNAGLEIATKLPDVAILSALLDAGAKTDHANDHGPVVFEWLAVMPVANLEALLDHELDGNLVDRFGTPLVVAAARADRWDLVALLMARSADLSRADAQGVRLADVVASRTESIATRPAPVQAAFARVRSRLSAKP